MPARAKDLKKKLSIPPGGITMILNGRSLYKAMVEQNWRQMPVQFGLRVTWSIGRRTPRAADGLPAELARYVEKMRRR